MKKEDIEKLQKLTILFVEDDINIRKSVSLSLEMLFKTVYQEQDGLGAYNTYSAKKPDFILTDISMPHKDGLELIEQIRKIDLKTPIIILSAYSSEEFLMKALNLQIDGYIIKPINLDKLLSSLGKSLQRIETMSKKDSTINLIQNFSYNIETKELFCAKNLIPLGKKENYLMDLLASNISKTITKDEISSHVWKNEYMSDSALKNLISSLRKKISKDAIVNVTGMGWKLDRRK